MTAKVPFRWDGYNATDIAQRCGLPHVELYAETESTLDLAHALAEKGAPAGTLIVADAQRAGRGRQGRAWSSPPGTGVWCSVIERPLDAKTLEVLSLRVGLRAAEGLDAFAGETIRVKWPNDLVLRAGKLGGILTEARWSGATLAWVAVGVGINVVLPPDVEGAAGLRDGVQRIEVLTAVVGAVRSAAATRGELSPSEIDRYRERDALRGRRVISPSDGTVVGVAASGALLVETPAGREQHRAGTVRFAEDT
jgi:BirA family biotin operon repressor/biotin-[acetyl-CoA-carboxylase] ligase